MRYIAAPCVLFLALLLGCSRGCSCGDSAPEVKAPPSSSAPPTVVVVDEPEEAPFGDEREVLKKARRAHQAPPKSVPLEECDAHCARLCEAEVKIPCEETEGRFAEFHDADVCEDGCMDRCERGRATYMAEGCFTVADCDAFFECLWKTAEDAGGNRGGRKKKRNGRERSSGGAPAPAMEE